MKLYVFMRMGYGSAMEDVEEEDADSVRAYQLRIYMQNSY
jgi:hypothetical protein